MRYILGEFELIVGDRQFYLNDAGDFFEGKTNFLFEGKLSFGKRIRPDDNAFNFAIIKCGFDNRPAGQGSVIKIIHNTGLVSRERDEGYDVEDIHGLMIARFCANTNIQRCSMDLERRVAWLDLACSLGESKLDDITRERVTRDVVANLLCACHEQWHDHDARKQYARELRSICDLLGKAHYANFNTLRKRTAFLCGFIPGDALVPPEKEVSSK